MVERFQIRLHAYVLMDNHYHLLIETPHANASRAMQWLNVSYSVWYNRKHRRIGPLFQGRFKGVLVDDEGAWALDASAYIHLNPVRLASLGAGKRDRKAASRGFAEGPSDDQVRAQLERLSSFRWSSFPAYVGMRPKPAWLTCDELLSRAGRGKRDTAGAYREWVEDRVTQGVPVEMEPRLKAGMVFGDDAFLDKVRGWVKGLVIRGEAEKPHLRQLRKWLPFEAIRKAVERVHGESWEAFRDRHGDWGRDTALVLAHRHAGLTYAELGRIVGMKPVTVAAAVRIMSRRVAEGNREACQQMKQVENEIHKLQT